METLLQSRGGAPLSPAVTEAIVTRSEGNPFFVEELLAAAGQGRVDLPHVLRDLLLQRVAQLDRQTQGVLRVAAAAGRDVPYPLLRTVADAPEGELRQALRSAVDHGVLVGDQAAGTFRFRHALLAEAIYVTLLPGEREELHARLAAELARAPQPMAAELAQHWAAAGRAPEALVASVAAGREAEAVFGLAEAVQHLYAEALFDLGEWDEADRVGAAAIRSGDAAWPNQRLVQRAALDVGRGVFDRARADLDAAVATVHDDKRGLAAFDIARVELALWERRWVDAEHAVDEGLRRLPAQEAALLRVRLCAQGLRAQAELAALARARRDSDALTDRRQRARQLLTAAREAAVEAAMVTPTAAAWQAVAEAEYDRAQAHPNPRSWEEAAVAWEALQRPPIVAYCQWRQAEALVAAVAPTADAARPARAAHATAQRLWARPLQEEIQRLAQRARLELAPPSRPTDHGSGLGELLGLTPREAEVLGLVARGYTNRQIAAALVVSVKTASVHVSHILAKLQVQNRVEAAAIAHRLAPPTPAAPSELPG